VGDVEAMESEHASQDLLEHETSHSFFKALLLRQFFRIVIQCTCAAVRQHQVGNSSSLATRKSDRLVFLEVNALNDIFVCDLLKDAGFPGDVRLISALGNLDDNILRGFQVLSK
jgi:hypothetical protein